MLRWRTGFVCPRCGHAGEYRPVRTRGTFYIPPVKKKQLQCKNRYLRILTAFGRTSALVF
ncbi:MAG: transposase [Trichloromonadaceae bacterium]